MMSRSIVYVSNNQTTELDLVRRRLSCTKGDAFYACPYPIVIDEEKAVGIEKVRELQRKLSLKPNKGQINCAVILRSETLTPEAQNALLKLLEEPPEDTIIVLVTRDKELLLPTVVSRCEIVYDIQQNSNFQFPISNFQFPNSQNIWRVAEELSKDRQKAIEWCEDLERECHQKITENGSVELAKKARRARDLIAKNINTRLVMENIFW